MPISKKGWELQIVRLRQEKRSGKAYARTVGNYQVFHDGTPQPALAGMVVERQGPGDNGPSGVKNHSRIAAGTYELNTHDGASNNKYMTIGYSTSGQINALPRPCLRFSPTGSRAGILIHPGNGYVWSIGCFNPGSNLKKATDDIAFSDSRARVIAILDDMRTFLGSGFPKKNNRLIPGAKCIVEGEP